MRMMRKTRATDGRVLLVVISVLISTLGAMPFAYGDNPATEGEQSTVIRTAVEDLLTELQRSLVRVKDAVDEHELPLLSNVTLKLKTTMSASAGGSVSLFVVDLGAEITDSSIVDVTLHLKPPRDSDTTLASSVSDLLAEAVISSLRAVKVAERGIPPLHLDRLKVTIRFAVESTGAGGIALKVFSFGGDVKTSTVQEMTVEFTKRPDL